MGEIVFFLHALHEHRAHHATPADETYFLHDVSFQNRNGVARALILLKDAVFDETQIRVKKREKMRVLLQRVRKAEVEVAGEMVAAIDYGMLIFVGIEARDCDRDFEWMASKLCKLRIFPDDVGVMNRSILEVGGQILAVSQFTLFASYLKGNRPSWGRAAPGEISKPRFEDFVARLEKLSGLAVPRGVFGADMQVHLINDGPVTLLLDSQAPE